MPASNTTVKHVRPYTMARVYERPRYTNQAKNKLIALAAATHDVTLAKKVATTLKLSPRDDWVSRMDYEALADLALDGEDVEDRLPGLNTKLEEYLLDAEIGRQAAAARLTAPAAARRIVRDYLEVCSIEKPATVVTDEEAVFWLVAHAYSDAQSYQESEECRIARRRACDLIKLQLPAQKISSGQFAQAYANTPLLSSPPPRYASASTWASAAERMLTRSHPMWVKYCRLWAAPPRRLNSRVQRMIDKVNESKPEDRHRADTLNAVMPGAKCYNYAGVIVVFIEQTLLVLDPAAIAYFRTCMVAYMNATWAFSACRVCGDTSMSDLSREFGRCLEWIASAIANTSLARHVARHMHLAYTRWQNSACEGAAPIDCGWADRDAKLAEDMLMFHPHNTKWWDLINSFGVPERTKAEFLKLYHLLPPPDVDALALHETLLDRTSNENQVKMSELDRFIRFCKAYDLCRYASKRRRPPKYSSDPGYSPADKTWFRRSLQGKLAMPPEDEWGKCWISREFPYDPTGDFHVLDAKDCTRVVADLGAYTDRSRSRTLGKTDQNELLSAIFNGPILSNGESMSAWRARVMEGHVTTDDDCIAAEAGKAENTKFGSKVRETLSASDNLREFLTEVDHSMRPLAALTPGVSIRVDMVKHKKKFQAMAHAISQTSSVHAFATSTDIAGWSPKMSRKMFHTWQTYALGTTECPNPESPIALWDKLVLFVDRRGIKRSDPCPRGNIQGWPATSDTTMHAHILIYWAYELRKRGILSKREAAHVLCLIDDAATVIALEGDVESCTQKAIRARELLAQTYSNLGFEMDDVKSFFSSIKFVYLNELYIDGTQVMHGCKTIMRIDRDFTRRFSSLPENIATAFGTAASAAMLGADPIVSYFIAAMHSFIWVFRALPALIEEPGHVLFAMALAPVTLNGLGVRALTSVMATGEADHLTWYIEIVGNMCSMLNVPRLDKVFNHILSQPITTRDAIAVFQNPTTVLAQSHRSAASAIRQAFREASRSHGLADPFGQLDGIETSPEYIAVVKDILESGTYEAAVLEEISASMPVAFVDEVMARVDRTELVSYLLGPTGIARVRRRVQACDAHNLEVLLDLSRGPSSNLIDFVHEVETSGSFAVAKNLRDKSLLASGFHVINHTYPCPFALWSFAGPIDIESAAARRMTTVTFSQNRLRQTAGSATLNLYDSSPTHPGYRGYRSLKSNVANEVRALIYNPVRKKVARGLAAVRWAQANGACIRALADLFLWSWAGNIDDRLLLLPGREQEGSAKRLSLRHSKTNHAVSMFANCQSAVVVNALAVTRHHATLSATGSTMYDMMASITTMRCAGLLEAALLIRNGGSGFEYGFTYKDSVIPLVQSAREVDTPSPLDLIHKVAPFANFGGTFGEAARRVCSFPVMSRTIDEYMDRGAEAAQRVYDAAVDEAGFDEGYNPEEDYGSVAVRHMNLRERYDASAHIWEAHLRRQRPIYVGPAAPMDAPRAITTTIAESAPLLDFRAAAMRISGTWRDSMALNLVEVDSRMAAELARWVLSSDPEWADKIENWAARSQFLRLRQQEFSSMVRDMQKFDPAKTPQECALMFFRYFGTVGFHYAPDAHQTIEVAWHQADSYMGTEVYINGAAKAVGMRLRDLKKTTSSEYSSVMVSDAKDDKVMVTRVLRAQWRLAAERRLMRAESLIRNGARMIETTGLNYEAVYYRVAARCLRATGRMGEGDWFSQVLSQTVNSLSNHIEAQVGRSTFAEEVAADDLDMAENITTLDQLVHRIRSIALIAQPIAGTTDPDAMCAALQEVATNVWQDIGGAHLAIPYKRSHVSISTSVLHSPSTIVVAHPVVRGDELPEPDFGTMMSGDELPEPDFGTMMSGDELPEPDFGTMMSGGFAIGSALDEDIEAADPADVVQWVFSSQDHLNTLGVSIDNIHKYYREVTASREGYAAWCQALRVAIDTSAYATPGFSILGAPAWEEDEEEGDVAM